MPIYRDKTRGCFVFEFDRVVEGQRVRARKLLPKTWTRAQADAYDRQEAARLYAVATRVERHQHTIEDAVAIYLKERVPGLKSGDNIMGELAQMYWAYQGRPMSALADACKEYTAKARKANGSKLAAATLRNRIRYLTSACRYAWKHHGMSEHDPADRVISPTVRNERRFFIDRRQMLQLCRASKHRATRAAIRIAFYSGMRISEIKRAERVNGMFVLHDTKNGEPRHVPIHPRIRCCVGIALPDQSRISKHFRDARKAVGMDWLHFHDLRHSAASEMINAGVDLYTVGAVLGHKSAVSTKRYAHLATDSIKDALTQIGRKKVA
ncbi:tyrosine-type recombinase/integrase [Paracandidimonas soli]|nr:site-specific integrase [Paracandidimonas soli]